MRLHALSFAAGVVLVQVQERLPELLTLFIVYYGVQMGIQSILAWFGNDQRIEINAFVAGMIALSVVFSSYCSEVLLSAFRAIPKGQYEAGDALGLIPYDIDGSAGQNAVKWRDLRLHCLEIGQEAID